MPAGPEYTAVLMGSGDQETGEGGSTIKEILRCSALGLVGVKIDVVICNNSLRKVPGFYRKIEEHNKEFEDTVEVRVVNRTRYPAEDTEEVEEGAQTLAEGQACADIVHEAGANLYVQAGFMKRVVGALLEIDGLNTHPGPLEHAQGIPGVDTKGLHGRKVQKAVLDRGYPYSAHTVHTVTEQYDSGDIIAWRPVLVRPGDTPQALFDRVQIVEKACLPFDIEHYVMGSVSV